MRLVIMSVGLLLAITLEGCGAEGAQAPSEVAGTWGADCSQPFVKFDGSRIKVFPDNATYDLSSAVLSGGQLTVAYTTPQGPVSEVYVQDGGTLRLDHGKYNGAEATWHKAPMKKCA